MQLFFFSRVVIRTPRLRGSFPPTPCTSQPHPAPGRPEKGAPGGSSPLPAATERIRCSIKTPSCCACSLLETQRLTILFTATKQSKQAAELCWASLCQGAENLHREGAGPEGHTCGARAHEQAGECALQHGTVQGSQEAQPGQGRGSAPPVNSGAHSAASSKRLANEQQRTGHSQEGSDCALTSRLHPERCRHTALSPQPAGRGD